MQEKGVAIFEGRLPGVTFPKRFLGGAGGPPPKKRTLMAAYAIVSNLQIFPPQITPGCHAWGGCLRVKPTYWFEAASSAFTGRHNTQQ